MEKDQNFKFVVLLQYFFKPFVYFIPVSDVPEGFYKFGSFVLIVNVVGVLKYIENH